MSRLRVLASVALPLLLAAGPVTRPAATGPASQPKLSDLAVMSVDYVTMPRLPGQTIGGLLDIRLDNDFLRVAVRDVPEGNWAVPVTGWPGLVQVNVLGGRMLHFQHFSFDDKGNTLFATHVQAHADYVQIARDFEDGRPGVQLIQSRQFADAKENPVRLMISDIGDPDGNRPATTKLLSATTFAALCREQPVDVRTYLLPVFRDLGAAALVRAGDLPGAYQVLAADLPADPATAKKVNATLARLADADAAVREKAADELAALGPAGVAELRRRDRTTLSPDAEATVATLVRTAEPLDAAVAETLSRDVPFLLDAMTLDDAAVTAAAVARIKTLTGETIDLPPGLPAAERDRRIAALSARLQSTTEPTRSSATKP